MDDGPETPKPMSSAPATEPVTRKPARGFWARSRKRIKHPRLLLVEIGAVVAGVATFTENIDRIESFVKKHFVPSPYDVVSDTTLGTTIRQLYTDTAGRMSILSNVSTVLDNQAELVPGGRQRLFAYVKWRTRPGGRRVSCGKPAPGPDVREAFRIAAIRRTRARYRIAGPETDLPRKAMSLDSAALSGLASDSADLKGVTLFGACLMEAKLPNAWLDSAVLDSANMVGADLTGAHMQFASLRWIEARGVVLENARLEGANLNGAVMPASRLSAARMACATFAGTHLDNANVRDARVEWAFFDHTDLTGVEWKAIDSTHLTSAWLRSAILDADSKAWSMRRGADASFSSPTLWTLAMQQQLADKNALCRRLAREP